MGIMSWDLDGGFSTAPVVRTPRITIRIRCEYPDTDMPPTEVTFRLSPRYGIHDACEAHEWFLEMMRQHDEFEVETDEAGEWPVPFSSDTVRRVVATNKGQVLQRYYGWYASRTRGIRRRAGTEGQQTVYAASVPVPLHQARCAPSSQSPR